MIKFLRNYWYYLTSVVFLVLAFCMGFWGVNRLTRVEVILMYSFMALLAHQSLPEQRIARPVVS